MGRIKELFEKKIRPIEEQLLTFGKEVSPKFGNVIILAGGGGSGKSYIMTNLLGFTPKVVNPDIFKERLQKTDEYRQMIYDKYRNAMTDELKEIFSKPIDLSNQTTVDRIHYFLKNLGLEDKVVKAFAKSVEDVSRLPNILFDGTLKTSKKVSKHLDMLFEVGYKPENVHLVWVINSEENNFVNNRNRARRVDDKRIFEAIVGSANNVLNIVKGENELTNKIGGDWYVVFNEAITSVEKTDKVVKNWFTGDSKTVKVPKSVSKRVDNVAKSRRPIVADYYRLKVKGKKPNYSAIKREVLERISADLPSTDWKLDK